MDKQFIDKCEEKLGVSDLNVNSTGKQIERLIIMKAIWNQTAGNMDPADRQMFEQITKDIFGEQNIQAEPPAKLKQAVLRALKLQGLEAIDK